MENKSKSSIGYTILWMIITAAVVYIVMSYSYAKDALENDEYYSTLYDLKSSTAEFAKLKKVMGVIERDYLKEYDMQKLEEGAIKGMLEALGDPYTSYFDKNETESFLMETEGDYEGVGMYISIDTKKDTVIVLSPIKGSPAEEAGVKPGDYITEINDVSVVGVSLEEVASRLKGITGSTVDVKFARYNASGDEEIIEKKLPRRKVELTSFEYKMLDGNIGYISFSSFDENVTEKFDEATKELFKKKKAKGLILDLRNNPGGLLSVAADVADKLLPTGRIVYTVDKNGNEETLYSDSNFIDVPIVVIVNKNSASASEILAAALKDYGWQVVGTTTYGKGIVQRIHRLNDGTAIKLTVSAYFTPSGRNIHGIGITPDIELEYDQEAYDADGTDNQVEKAIEVLKKIR